jgi:hypothetical protein
LEIRTGICMARESQSMQVNTTAMSFRNIDYSSQSVWVNTIAERIKGLDYLVYKNGTKNWVK